MKKIFILTLLVFSSCFSCCSKDDNLVVNVVNETIINPTLDNTSNKMKITIEGKVFNVTLSNNPSVTAFKALLPLTLTMNELNTNEKVYHLNTVLPTNSSPGGTIQVGDLMLYGNNALVLFYESFNTSYTYTRLGKVDDISGFKTALGSGNVRVKFELQ